MRYIPLQILATLAICLTATAGSFPLDVRIDLGNVDSGTGVNNLSNHTNGSLSPLVNMVGQSQPNYSVAVTNAFVGVNSNGTQSPSTSMTLPATGSQDSFYGNNTDATGEIRVTMDSYRLYNIRIFASVTGVSDNRETKYVATGANTVQGTLNPANNTTNHLHLYGIAPDANGHITIKVTKGANNTSTDGSFYIGWIEVGVAAALDPFVTAGDRSLHVTGRNSSYCLDQTTLDEDFFQLQAPEHPAGTRNPVLESGITKISVGSDHTVFIKSNGTLWGMGNKRSLGISYSGSDYYQKEAVPLTYGDGSVVTNVVACATGYGNTLFVRADKTVCVVGNNTFGCLGVGHTNWVSSFTQLTDASNNAYDNVTAVVAGLWIAAFVHDGKVHVMGNSNVGFAGTNNYPRELSSTITNVTKLASRGSHMAFLTSGGALYTIGLNEYGQLGIGNTTLQTSPQQVESSGVLDVATGFSHTIYVKQDGATRSLWGMGHNNLGQLGVLGGSSRSIYPSSLLSTTDAVSVAAGQFSTYFLESDGDLKGFGNNDTGQLGVVANADGHYHNTQDIKSNVLAVAAGWGHLIALHQGDPAIEVMDDANQAVAVGSTSYLGTTDGSAVLKTFKIKNTGQRDLAVGTISFIDGQATDFSIETAPPSTIASGETGSFTVRFTPGDAGPRTTTVSIGNDDPATGKNPYTFTLNAATHTAPVVDAGDRIVVNPPHTFPVVVELNGTVTDDGLPGPLTRNWSVTTTPPGVDLASVTFTAADQDSTSVSLPSAGAYVFALTANDSAATTTDSVSVILNITVPTVFAGEEKWIGMDNLETPVVGSVTGTASDIDGLPNALTTTWRLKQGNNAVVIANPDQLTTNVTFSAPGEYVLELEAYDGGAKTTSTMTYYVGARPTVSAGEDITIYYPETTQVTIDATVVGANEIQWAKVTGPDGCTITGATVANPVITFTQDGIYTFQVSATFGDVSETDTVTITVIHRTNIFPARGYAGIGTVTPGEHLEVLGKVKAADLIVTTKGADYVFAKDYKLKALAEVEAFITQHKHLPGIAPAAEMQKNGMKVSQLATLQLAKIEELTLHTIALKKRNEALRKQNAETEKLIKTISQQLDRLEQNQGGLE